MNKNTATRQPVVRLEGTVTFQEPIPETGTVYADEGIDINVDGTSFRIDFERFEASIDKGDRRKVNFAYKDRDWETFPEGFEALTLKKLRDGTITLEPGSNGMITDKTGSDLELSGNMGGAIVAARNGKDAADGHIEMQQINSLWLTSPYHEFHPVNLLGRAYRADMVKSLYLTSGESAKIRYLLTHAPKDSTDCMGEDETVSFMVSFDGGYEMDIKLCGVQYDDSPDACNLPYTEAVLFQNGAEVCCTEPSDEFFGLWELEDGNMKFTVFVGDSQCEKLNRRIGDVPGIKEILDDPRKLDVVPECLRTPEMYEALIKKDPCFIARIPASMLTPELIELAICQTPQHNDALGRPMHFGDILHRWDQKHTILNVLIDSFLARHKEEQTEAKIIAKETGLGTLIAEESGDTMYPGIDISIRRNGMTYGLALAEVVEAGDETGRAEPEFHLRPFVAAEKGTKDETGTPIPRRITWDAPFADICIKADDFTEYTQQDGIESRKGATT